MWGYGLRYKYGLFKQRIEGGLQHEVAEDWLDLSNPWEIRRDLVKYPVKFSGTVENGEWIPGDVIEATAYDLPIPGYGTTNTISLRLWNVEAESSRFDLKSFNDGSHLVAHKSQIKAEDLCSVLYPGDDTDEGKELRLRQQYFVLRLHAGHCGDLQEEAARPGRQDQLAVLPGEGLGADERHSPPHLVPLS